MIYFSFTKQRLPSCGPIDRILEEQAIRISGQTMGIRREQSGLVVMIRGGMIKNEPMGPHNYHR